MVKVEDFTDNGDNPTVDAGINSTIGVDSSVFKPCSSAFVVKEESFPCSSSSHLKSYLVGMGFSSILVDTVIEENGEDDINVLLEALLTHSAHPMSCRASETLSNYSHPKKESPPFDFTRDDKQDEKDEHAASYMDAEKRSYLLMMDFTEDEIDVAITRLGGNSSLGELVDFIIASQIAGPSEGKEMQGSINGGNESMAISTEALFGTMDKTLSLLRMGFTEYEISSAVAKFGSDAPLNELADSILTSRLIFQVKEEDVCNDDIYFSPQEQNEFEQLGHVKEEYPLEFPPPPSEPWLKQHPSHSTSTFDEEEKTILKKAKLGQADDSEASCSAQRQNSGWSDGPSTDAAAVKKEEMPDHVPRNLSAGKQGGEFKPPFFLYGNVADVSHGTWQKLSQFLHGTEPEFVNSQFFSALVRKEGYLHNLPSAGRFHVMPKPPTTIECILPHTKRWWPSWDARKQLSCINSETAGVPQLCNRLGQMMAASQGMLSKELQTEVLHQCKSLNLIWVGPHKLCPMEPAHLEQVLGYPRNHTDLPGGLLELPGRLAALKHSFQTDTIGYQLSVLKSIYPDGLRLFSIFSGIGGAEVSLHRLGIPLRCVVSVEASDSNRRIFRQWWDRTGQSGQLRQIAGVEKLTIWQIERLVKEFGGFDIIIASNPSLSGSSGSNKDGLVGMDLNHFYEFTRILHRLRGVMGAGNPGSAGRRNL